MTQIIRKTFIKLILLFSIPLRAQEDGGIPIHGFFDVSANYDTKTGQVNLHNGALDFYFTKNINSRINIFIDLVFEYVDTAYISDLERMYIGYDVNEYLQTTFGKFHTPIGYWNNAFHHGLQLQTSILRPKFLNFNDEGGILPVHTLGILASADINDFSYRIYISTGSSIVSKETNSSITNNGIITPNESGAHNGDKLYGINLSYYVMEDIKMGIHSFYQRVSIFNNRSTDVFMYGAYLFTEFDSLEFSTETYLFSNKNNSGSLSSEILNSNATYAQIAYDFNGLKPYARVEFTHYDQNDFYFHAQEVKAGDSYKRGAIGVNYSLDPDANIKCAIIYTEDSLLGNSYNFRTQFAIRF